MEHIIVKSFKANGRIHRSWYNLFKLEENDEYIVVGSLRTFVIESNGRNWVATEPCISVYFKNAWFNVLGIFKKDGLSYYCNLASPSIIEDGVIKYIDFDLDIKLRHESIKILDENEYKYNSRRMKYDSRLDEILKKEELKIKELMEAHKFPFDDQKIKQYLVDFKNSCQNH